MAAGPVAPQGAEPVEPAVAVEEPATAAPPPAMSLPPAAPPAVVPAVPEPPMSQPTPVPPSVPAEAVLPPPTVVAPGSAPSTGRMEIVIEPAVPRVPAKPLGAPVDAARARTLELEVGLAKGTQVYLVLDPPRQTLEIKARGLTLDSFPVKEMALLHHGSLLGGGAGEPPPAPVVWKVEGGPGDASREVIAPDSLRPYVAADEREDAEQGETNEEPEAKPIPTPPTAYRVRVDAGWELAILDRPPAPPFVVRYAMAVRDGLLSLIGRRPERPPLLAVTVDPEDARRLHHVFRSELAVLIAAGAPPSP